MMADMSVLRVTYHPTLRELTIIDSNVICETTLQVLRVALAIYDELELPGLFIQRLFVAIICFEMV